jgi:hypothetical protein
MAIRKLERKEWHPYFNKLSKLLGAKVAEVDVASLKTGAQAETKWVPLLGITYDSHDDVVDVALDGVDHLIEKPRTIYVDNTGATMVSLEIDDAEGVKHIVKLKEPLELPRHDPELSRS